MNRSQVNNYNLVKNSTWRFPSYIFFFFFQCTDSELGSTRDYFSSKLQKIALQPLFWNKNFLGKQNLGVLATVG